MARSLFVADIPEVKQRQSIGPEELRLIQDFFANQHGQKRGANLVAAEECLFSDEKFVRSRDQ